MRWFRDNATTMVGWVVVISLALGARLASLDAADVATAETARDVDSNSQRITVLESDVRLLSQTVRRQEQVVTRQEQAQQDLDKIVVELRTIVEVGHGR
jgi:TolA-binding protein